MSEGGDRSLGMRTLPTLWYPVCPACQRRATERASLGDEAGPRDHPEQNIKCIGCGRETHVDDHSNWEAEPLEA